MWFGTTSSRERGSEKIIDKRMLFRKNNYHIIIYVNNYLLNMLNIFGKRQHNTLISYRKFFIRHFMINNMADIYLSWILNIRPMWNVIIKGHLIVHLSYNIYSTFYRLTNYLLNLKCKSKWFHLFKMNKYKIAIYVWPQRNIIRFVSDRFNKPKY